MNYHFIRKSKRILLLIILQTLIIISFICFALVIFYHIIKHAGKEISYTLLIISYFLVLWGYFSVLIAIIRYFFDILIITEKNIYKFKIGPFFIEDVSIIEIYRIQEIKAFSDGLLRIILNIGELHLIQANDKYEIIHNLDNPKKIAKIIEKIKIGLIKKEGLPKEEKTCIVINKKDKENTKNNKN